jgi:hypothetical protein
MTGLAGYFLGIAPNFLGGSSLAAALIVIWPELGLGFPERRRFLIPALFALVGLWSWEGVQAFTRMTFDLHDIFWTVPGVAVALIGALAMLPQYSKHT